MIRALGQHFLLPGAPAMAAQFSPSLQHTLPPGWSQQSPLSQQVPAQSIFVLGQQVPPTHISVGLQHEVPHCLRLGPHWQVPLTHF
jgi:hypothetical protein